MMITYHWKEEEIRQKGAKGAFSAFDPTKFLLPLNSPPKSVKVYIPKHVLPSSLSSHLPSTRSPSPLLPSFLYLRYPIHSLRLFLHLISPLLPLSLLTSFYILPPLFIGVCLSSVVCSHTWGAADSHRQIHQSLHTHTHTIFSIHCPSPYTFSSSHHRSAQWKFPEPQVSRLCQLISLFLVQIDKGPSEASSQLFALFILSMEPLVRHLVS